MFLDLHHEFDVLASFLARETARITLEEAQISASTTAVGPTHVVDWHLWDRRFHPDGPGSAEVLVCRMTITEINALVEDALQSTLLALLGPDGVFETKAGGGKGEHVLDLSRRDIERCLIERGIDVLQLPGFTEVCHIEMLAEGFRHHMRLEPTKRHRHIHLYERLEKGPWGTDSGPNFSRLGLLDVQGYLDAARRFGGELYTRELEIKKARG